MPLTQDWLASLAKVQCATSWLLKRFNSACPPLASGLTPGVPKASKQEICPRICKITLAKLVDVLTVAQVGHLQSQFVEFERMFFKNIRLHPQIIRALPHIHF